MSQQRALPSSVPAFRPGGEFTLGAEEEILLVDRHGSLTELGSALPRLTSSVIPAGQFSPEIYACEIEFETAVVPTAGELVSSLAEGRRHVAREGFGLLATGLHPRAGLGDVRLMRSARYDAVSAELAGLLRTPTAAYQVHVGLPDAASMVKAFRGLRNQLSIFRALAAGSPFWHGRDSGLASARAAILWSYPRIGVPPVFHSYDEYVSTAHQHVTAAGVPDYTYLWWDMRPQPRLGTIEVRVMDAVTSVALAGALAALAQGLARHAVEKPSTTDLPDIVLRENDFRAVRYGLDAWIIDVEGRKRPVRDVIHEASGHARCALGKAAAEPLDALVAELSALPESERQRRLVERAGLAGLLTDLTRRTAATCPATAITAPDVERSAR